MPTLSPDSADLLAALRDGPWTSPSDRSPEAELRRADARRRLEEATRPLTRAVAASELLSTVEDPAVASRAFGIGFAAR